MPRASLPTSDSPPDGIAPRDLIAGQIAVLTRLTDIGMEIAEAAGRRAANPPDADAPAAVPDPGLTYARAARAVRLTIALQSRLLGDLAALDRGDAQARATEAATRRERIHRLIERAIEAAVEGERDEDEDAVERLSTEAWERLTEADDDDLADCPLSEVVARICHDLGLAPAAAALAAQPFLAVPLVGEPAPLNAAYRPGGDERRLDPRLPGDDRCERGP